MADGASGGFLLGQVRLTHDFGPGDQPAGRPIGAIPQVLAEMGMEPARVMAVTGITLGLFDDSKDGTSFAAMDWLLPKCMARAG